jgi:dienelactone hydrolase
VVHVQRRVGADPADLVLPAEDGGGPRRPALPVVLVLQGANVGRARYRGLARALARQGFLVVVPDHRRRFPPLPLPGRPMLLPEPGQVGDLLAALPVWNREPVGSPLRGRVAERRLVLIGHSMGGLAAMNALRDVCRWPLCRGGYRRPEALLAAVTYGTGLRGHFGGGIPVIDTAGRPLALLQGSSDGLTPAAEISATFARIRSLPRALITIEGANHYGITDTVRPGAVAGLAAPRSDPRRPAVPQAASIAAIAHWSGLFLRGYALGEAAARRRFETEAGRAGSGVQLQSTGTRR